jgi:hypothetical protein
LSKSDEDDSELGRVVKFELEEFEDGGGCVVLIGWFEILDWDLVVRLGSSSSLFCLDGCGIRVGILSVLFEFTAQTAKGGDWVVEGDAMVRGSDLALE